MARVEGGLIGGGFPGLCKSSSIGVTMIDPREKTAYLNATPVQREVTLQNLRHVLGVLRVQSLAFQTSHWQVTGDSAYGNHLLFQRLYESTRVQIDELAEKLVGYLGVGSVDLGLQLDLMVRYHEAWSAISCLHTRGLQSEADLQAAIQAAYDGIKAVGAMTLGLDDWLTTTANAHETNSYLLQQVKTQTPESSITAAGPSPVAPSAEDSFHLPESSEVREFADTDAVSNDPEVAAEAANEDNLDLSRAQAVRDSEQAPPIPTDIVEQPGGKDFSTLNRYLVETEDQITLASWTLGLE